MKVRVFIKECEAGGTFILLWVALFYFLKNEINHNKLAFYCNILNKIQIG